MKRSRVYALEVLLVLVVLVVSGCAAPKAEPCPTTVPQSCPTTSVQSCPTTVPQSCPTAAAQAMPEMNAWRRSISYESNVVITFDKGAQCSMKVLGPLVDTQMNIEIVVNDSSYQNYMVVYMTLDPGKTLADLEAWTSADRPPYAQFVALDIVSPQSRTAHSLPTIDGGELYFSCLVQGPDTLKIIGSVGLVEIPKK